MKTLFKRIFQLVALLIVGFVILIALNYFNSSLHPQSAKGKNLKTAGTTISVLNWNLGYAGLGKDSDFIADGGENFFPPSKAHVQNNLAGIQGIIAANRSDIHVFQEVSEPDTLTLGVDVLSGVREALPEYEWFYTNDISTRFIPQKNAVHHGLASFTRIETSPVQTIRLPLEPTRLNGLIQRQYHIQVREFTDENGAEWAVMNIHLSAFDEGGNVRVQQFEKLLEIADIFYQKGKHVVIGGDWNMQLMPTDFPYTTEEKFLFWLKVLPHESLKADWKILVDPTVPTVRSNERTYHKGENYTTIIDGFLVSPNVEAVKIKTIDTNFEFTDHQAVYGEFKARP